MVSRYGVAKEGAVGVAVGVGPMHCLLPHCGGPPHNLSPHPQNHNHIHPHNHHPPPSASPHGHLNQLNHAQHQLTININHHQHQPPQQQSQHQQAPPQYRIITASARSDFHVPGQNYGAQPGGQVGGGGNSIGAPGNRGPPPLGGIQSIGQSTAGIPPGGPTGGQQAPPQAPTPGVQSQQPQGPAPTTTPPVHTPSPQEMGKQAHLQAQPSPLQQVYVPNQTRPASQGYYQTGPRPQQQRGLTHRGGHGGGGSQVVGMSGVGGGGGQPTGMYPHPAGITVQPGQMYVQSQVPGLHTGPQPAVYPMNSQMPIQFTGPHHRPQTHQSQNYYPSYPHAVMSQNLGFGIATSPAPQHGYFTFPPPSAPINLSRAGAGAVSGGAQHFGGPLAGAQGTTIVQQGSLPQPAQQPQQIPPMSIPLSQTEVYSGHNGGASSLSNSTSRYKKPRREKAILDIVNPKTGKNISGEIYEDDDTTPQSGDSSNRETPQPQNYNMEVVAQFAALVAKAANERKSDLPKSAGDSAAENAASSQNASLPNLKIQTNPSSDTNSQCNTGPSTPTQSTPSVPSSHNSSQSLSPSNAIQSDSCPVKVESKPLQHNVKEFQPRSEIKIVAVEEVPVPAVVVNTDVIPAQPFVAASAPVPEAEDKSTADSVSTAASVPSVSIPSATVPSSNVSEAPVPPVVTPSANPVPVREPFPSLSSKNSSNSPPRRKSQSQGQPSGNAVATELPPSGKEQQKERKTSEKSLVSRGTALTPASQLNQAAEQQPHQKANGETTGDKQEPEVAPRSESHQQKSADGKATQKQKPKRGQLKNRDLNRKGAEKEGTDMDAFMNPAAPVKSEVKQQQQQQQQQQHQQQQQDIKESLPAKDSNKESVNEVTKEIKEKDNQETKKEREVKSGPPLEKIVTPQASKESTPVPSPVPSETATVIQNNREPLKEASAKIEDNSRTEEACKMPVKAVANDVVDHAKVNDEIELESAIVAQKNEENSKVSALRVGSEERQPAAAPDAEKEDENQLPNQIEPVPRGPPSLKYLYKDDQWSPINTSGKKVYDRDFLMKLQDDPNSKVKPLNLPDLEVVLKDITRNRNTRDLGQFKDANLTRHESLYPGFVKSSLSAKGPVPNKKSYQGKPRTNKPNVIHVSLSLREDVKLRETENAWKPTRMKSSELPEDVAKTELLYKKVRSVLNKLTPQKFDTLVNQVRALEIDTQERLQGVINLVFEKAVDEPSFSVAYALMCKELALMQVMGTATDKNTGKQDTSVVNFRKLIIARCQTEFEKNSVDEIARAEKLKEIKGCSDPEKKEMLANLEEEERRIRIKSVGNIRFIGELYKQSMLTSNIMHRCIQHLLHQIDEENLECLCKLLTTIGKDLESKSSDLSDCFQRMREIAGRKTGPNKISSRVRFMLQDVIDLRSNHWIPRRDDSNPKTIDQIQKEVETERLDTQFNTPLNTPRKDDRNNDRKRNRGGSTEDGGWSQPISRTRQTYSVETSKLKSKPPPMDDLQLGSRNAYMWTKNVPAGNSKTPLTPNKFACLENMPSADQDKRVPLQLSGSRSTGPREYGRMDYKSPYDGRGSRNDSHQLGSGSSSRESSLLDSSRSQSVNMPPPIVKSAPQAVAASSSKPAMTDEQFTKATTLILDEYLSEPNLDNVAQEIREKFDKVSTVKFAREAVNGVLEKSSSARERVSRLLSYLISQKILTLTDFISGLREVIEMADDLIIDIPKIWSYLAELLVQPIVDDVHPMSDLKITLATLRTQGNAGKLIGELFSKLARDKGPKWVKDKWDKSGLKWSDIVDEERENVNSIIKEHKLEFLIGGSDSTAIAADSQLSMEQIHEQLLKLMTESKDFDGITSWINANVGPRVKDPRFIRTLMTAVLEASTEKHNKTWKLQLVTFQNLQTLIHRYVDTNESLELQCLFAIQAYINKIEHPFGLLLNIIEKLADDNILSYDAFLAWESNTDPAEFEGKAVAMKSLTSFFTSLKEADDVSSSEEV